MSQDARRHPFTETSLCCPENGHPRSTPCRPGAEGNRFIVAESMGTLVPQSPVYPRTVAETMLWVKEWRRDVQFPDNSQISFSSNSLTLFKYDILYIFLNCASSSPAFEFCATDKSSRVHYSSERNSKRIGLWCNRDAKLALKISYVMA